MTEPAKMSMSVLVGSKGQLICFTWISTLIVQYTPAAIIIKGTAFYNIFRLDR